MNFDKKQQELLVEASGKMDITLDSIAGLLFSDLNVIVFRHLKNNGVYTHTAVCIQFELDACGNSFDEAVEGLKRAIGIYFNAMAEEYESSEEFAQNVIRTAYSQSKQKDELFSIYKEAEGNYLREQAQRSKIQIPKIEPSSIVSFLHRNAAIDYAPAQVN